MPRRLELTTISHSCNDSARRNRANTWRSRQSKAVFVALMPLDDLSFDSSNLFFKYIDMIKQGIDSLAGDRW
jgi:hypothetical protein